MQPGELGGIYGDSSAKRSSSYRLLHNIPKGSSEYRVRLDGTRKRSGNLPVKKNVQKRLQQYKHFL
jgi:hypothetical protein